MRRQRGRLGQALRFDVRRLLLPSGGPLRSPREHDRARRSGRRRSAGSLLRPQPPTRASSRRRRARRAGRSRRQRLDRPRERARPSPRGSAVETDGGIPWKIVLWVAAALYAVVFLLMNNEKQEVSFVFFTVNTRLIWLILPEHGARRRARPVRAALVARAAARSRGASGSVEQAGEDPNAVRDPLGRLVREREPRGARTSRTREEVRPTNERDARLGRALEQLAGVDARRRSRARGSTRPRAGSRSRARRSSGSSASSIASRCARRIPRIRSRFGSKAPRSWSSWTIACGRSGGEM